MNSTVRGIVDYLSDPQSPLLEGVGRLLGELSEPTPPGPSPTPPDRSGRRRDPEKILPDPRADLTRARAALAQILQDIELGQSGLSEDQEEGLASFVSQAMVKLRWADRIFDLGGSGG